MSRALLASLALLTGCLVELPPGVRADDDGQPPRARDSAPFLPPRDGAPPVVTDQAAPPPPPADIGRPPPDRPPDAGPRPDVRPPPPDARPRPPGPGPETCDGVDNDRDGLIDETPVCGEYIVNHCALSVGWADRRGGPAEGAMRWSSCPQEGRYAGGPPVRCANTDQSPAFGVMEADENVFTDEFGVQLTCSGPEPAVDTWVQARCRFYLGWAPQIDDTYFFLSGACLSEQMGNRVRCASTGGDGRFHKFEQPSRYDSRSALGVIWLCVDTGQATRAVAATSAVEVFLGWARDARTTLDIFGVRDGAERWAACPDLPRSEGGTTRCTSTLGNGLLNTLRLTDFVPGAVHRYGVMWRARR